MIHFIHGPAYNHNLCCVWSNVIVRNSEFCLCYLVVEKVYSQNCMIEHLNPDLLKIYEPDHLYFNSHITEQPSV